VDDLTGKVALITGGAGGLGMGLARAFVDEHMRVVIADINQDALERAVESFTGSGAEVLGAHADVTDADSMAGLRERAYGRFGTVDVLCNNAMVGGGGPLAEPVDIPKWESVMAANVYSVLHGLNTFLPRMIEQGSGHIVNTASRQGLVPGWTLGAYPPAKAAMISLSEMLHDEFIEQQLPIGVTVLTPGGIRTPGLISTVAAVEHSDPAQHALLAPRLADAVEPDDLGRLVVRAIKQGTFYVNSHRETLTWLQQRVDRMVADADRLGTLR
jgi:NAD(P)-dependent dehydrogenase (short-subunit alcohol dehydrogenase family)